MIKVDACTTAFSIAGLVSERNSTAIQETRVPERHPVVQVWTLNWEQKPQKEGTRFEVLTALEPSIEGRENERG